jgi:hypothetical protein
MEVQCLPNSPTHFPLPSPEKQSQTSTMHEGWTDIRTDLDVVAKRRIPPLVRNQNLIMQSVI